MKKISIFILVAVVFSGMVFAQPQRMRQRAPREVEVVSLDGTLKLEKGTIALESGEKTYFVPSLHRYTGFIDGLKEGASVSVKGQVRRNTIAVRELTVNGKQYDLAPQNRRVLRANRSIKT